MVSESLKSGGSQNVYLKILTLLMKNKRKMIPIIRFGKKGIGSSFIACSSFIAPFLLVLNQLIKTNRLFFLAMTQAYCYNMAYQKLLIILLIKGAAFRRKSDYRVCTVVPVILAAMLQVFT